MFLIHFTLLYYSTFFQILVVFRVFFGCFFSKPLYCCSIRRGLTAGLHSTPSIRWLRQHSEHFLMFFFSKPRYCFAKLGAVSLLLDSPTLAVLLHLCQICLCLRGRIVCHVGEQLSEKVKPKKAYIFDRADRMVSPTCTHWASFRCEESVPC